MKNQMGYYAIKNCTEHKILYRLTSVKQTVDVCQTIKTLTKGKGQPCHKHRDTFKKTFQPKVLYLSKLHFG